MKLENLEQYTFWSRKVSAAIQWNNVKLIYETAILKTTKKAGKVVEISEKLFPNGCS
jgi:hypothetical protein